jgi:hypothetical protein
MKPKPLLCLALLLGSFFNSSAQPGPQFEVSLDAMVAKSQGIFRGSVSDYTITRDPEHGFKYTLCIHIVEVLKGHPQCPVELTVYEHDLHTNEFEQLADRHTPFLYFVNHSMPEPWVDVNEYWWRAILLDESHSCGLPAGLFNFLGSPNLFNFLVRRPVTLMDSTGLTNSADILASTRRIARQRFASTNTFWLGGGWFYLEVPVTPALEKRAQQLIRSNDWSSQQAGIEALGCFKSVKNIRLLKPLLNDSNSTDVSYNNRPWDNERIYHPRKAAYDVLTNWGINVSEPVWKEGLPWHYDPAVRHDLNVYLPTALSADPLGPAGDNIAIDSKEGYWTNVLVGSNMITGTKCEWFVYPDGQPKPSKPTHVHQDYWPTPPSEYFNKTRGDDLPVAGQKYLVEMNYTLFETDNPPVDRDQWGEFRMDIWRPQDGKHYRVLVEQTLKTTFGP